jgi:hypothetical protein
MAQSGRIGFGAADALAAADPDEAGGPDVPGDLIASDVVTGTAGGLPKLASTVDRLI